MPVISQHPLEGATAQASAPRRNETRLAGAWPHQVHYFHQVDDPYSALVAGTLPQFVARYDIDVVAHVVGPPPDSAAPEREKLMAYSRKDARLLAGHWNLAFEEAGAQPPEQAVAARNPLAGGRHSGRHIRRSGG